eukprot:COSAG04_NODE_5387_length_1634_cov_1.373290_3_plen_158_part_01
MKSETLSIAVGAARQPRTPTAVRWLWPARAQQGAQMRGASFAVLLVRPSPDCCLQANPPATPPSPPHRPTDPEAGRIVVQVGGAAADEAYPSPTVDVKPVSQSFRSRGLGPSGNNVLFLAADDMRPEISPCAQPPTHSVRARSWLSDGCLRAQTGTST